VKRYGVCIPITGFVYVEVEAGSKREAIDKAFEQDLSEAEIEEWNLHEHVTEGNVCHATLNSARAEEIKS
jgi:hypothetical protein